MSRLAAALEKIRNQPSKGYQGKSFEDLVRIYLRKDPLYEGQYKEVLTYGDWVEKYGKAYGETRKSDTGIDLVAVTPVGKFHAVQCKNYASDYCVGKGDIDSFFTASGKSWFEQRIIVTTTNHWTNNAEAALANQNPPVIKIDLQVLENSKIDWMQWFADEKNIYKENKTLKQHQKDAVEKVCAGLATADRGKLIMACGTGKTFTSLKIAERLAGKGKYVLFLVPSLSLQDQSITEWAHNSELELSSFAIGSDSTVGTNKGKNKDDDRIAKVDSVLGYPATTDPERLKQQIKERRSSEVMTVIFSTYQSIKVIEAAQKGLDAIPDFDLIICDEAHRTAGAESKDQAQSFYLVLVHDNNKVHGKKRLYMTATPRVYESKDKKSKQDLNGVVIHAMNDQEKYGEELYRLDFSEAVAQGLLVDYKVIVLTRKQEEIINRYLGRYPSAGNGGVTDGDVAKIIGCWKSLSKQGLEGVPDTIPMRRAVAFCQVIEETARSKRHKISSKVIAQEFARVVSRYQETEKTQRESDSSKNPALAWQCEAKHIDGKMTAGEKKEQIAWLKSEPPENTCRILCNVRCLTEGVDVPALDAVMFLAKKSSKVDIVQAVGRVMRNAPGKKMGYVILPAIFPDGVDPEEALERHEAYGVIWDVLNALRSHDSRLNDEINAMPFNNRLPSQIIVNDRDKDRLSTSSEDYIDHNEPVQQSFSFAVSNAIRAKIIDKCGDREYWEEWTDNIAKIVARHIEHIKQVLADQTRQKERQAFERFASYIRKDLNPYVSEEELIMMLGLHMVSRPVFDALFADEQFSQNNPMSIFLQAVVDELEGENLAEERQELASLYASVQRQAKSIKTTGGRQNLIKERYEELLKKTFPKMVDRLGMVYTPIEVVDFIVHSVDAVMRKEFNKSLATPGVRIFDPFTGTGTFITRLLSSEIIPPASLAAKYQEIYANEIDIFSYYIAAINIESSYHQRTGRYQPFPGICFTDTFQGFEAKHDLAEAGYPNSERLQQQKNQTIEVIIGNPPYSAGQKSENDNNKNTVYPCLNKSIAESYAARSTAVLKRGLYDSYVRAIRYASWRIGERGVIGFITNAGYLDSNVMDGMRRCLTEEFTCIYIVHLRGRALGADKNEGGNVFNIKTPVAISILVKNPDIKERGQIYFYEIGDKLSKEEKLKRLREWVSIDGIDDWQTIKTDQFGDWISLRDPHFDRYISLGNKRNKQLSTVFRSYSSGVKTNRDAWCYNASSAKLAANMRCTIEFYNQEVVRTHSNDKDVSDDDTKISWTAEIKEDLKRGKQHAFDADAIVTAMYRPFIKQRMYFSRRWNNSVYQIPKLFPMAQKNLVIIVTGRGSQLPFSAMLSQEIPDFEMISKGQCFPEKVFAQSAISNQQSAILYTKMAA